MELVLVEPSLIGLVGGGVAVWINDKWGKYNPHAFATGYFLTAIPALILLNS